MVKNPFVVKKKMKIAQMVVNRYIKASFRQVDNLSETKRSDGGFGSTGQ